MVCLVRAEPGGGGWNVVVSRLLQRVMEVDVFFLPEEGVCCLNSSKRQLLETLGGDSIKWMHTYQVNITKSPCKQLVEAPPGPTQ